MNEYKLIGIEEKVQNLENTTILSMIVLGMIMFGFLGKLRFGQIHSVGRFLVWKVSCNSSRYGWHFFNKNWRLTIGVVQEEYVTCPVYHRGSRE